MRVFPGAFVNFDYGTMPAPIERYAPSIAVALRSEERVESFDLLIDTGSEISIMYPRESALLFGANFGEAVLQRNIGREYIGSVSGHLNYGFRVPLEMTFHDEDGIEYQLDRSLLVVEPEPPNLDDPSADRGNWDTPSLLGRDLLLHFDLHVSGARGEVYLSLPD